MENIYHIHQSSNSYWDKSWTDTDYYLCGSEEEYQQKMAEYQQKAQNYIDSGRAKRYGEWRIKCGDEGKVHANEYYYAHEWQGKTFDAVGFCYEEHLERSNHYKYFLKPGSVTGLKNCTDRGCGWMYGS